MVVLHYTAMGSCVQALNRLSDPETEVSAHYVISESGQVFQMVPEDLRAWHAGAGSWGTVSDLNSHSIGIELANGGPDAGLPPFPEPQMIALELLMAGVMERWAIPAKNVIAHSDMAPTRKFDPGPKFDWRRLALQGFAVWSDAKSDDVRPSEDKFLALASSFGYNLPDPETSHDPFRDLLRAFRLRFAPYLCGELTSDDMAIISDLAWRYPFEDAIDQQDQTT